MDALLAARLIASTLFPPHESPPLAGFFVVRSPPNSACRKRKLHLDLTMCESICNIQPSNDP